MNEKAELAKNYLQQICSLNNDIREDMLLLEQLRSEAERITTVITDEPKRQHFGNSTERRLIDYITNSDAVKDEILEKSGRKLEMTRTIKSQIDTLENPKHRRVLSAKYVRMKSFEEVFDEMHEEFDLNDLRNIYRIRDRALECFYDKFEEPVMSYAAGLKSNDLKM